MITAPQKRDYEKLLPSMPVLQVEVKTRGFSSEKSSALILLNFFSHDG